MEQFNPLKHEAEALEQIKDVLFEIYKRHPKDREAFLKGVEEYSEQIRMPPDVKDTFTRFALDVYDSAEPCLKKAANEMAKSFGSEAIFNGGELPIFSSEQIEEAWPQVRGELVAFAKHLEKTNSQITAAQLRLALHLAEEAYLNRKSKNG